MNPQTVSLLFSSFSLVFFLASVSAREQGRDEALFLLSQWKQSQKWYEKFSVHVDTTYRSIVPFSPKPTSKSELTIRRLGPCLDISGFAHRLDLKEGEFSQKIHIVINKKMAIKLGSNWGRKIQEQFQDAIVTVKKRELELHGELCRPSSGALDGYVCYICDDGRGLADIMLGASELTLLGRESIDGYSCQRICAKTRYGVAEVWLDGENGCLPRRYVFKKGPDDLCCRGEKRLRETNLYRPEDRPNGVFVSSWSCILDQVEIIRQSGFFFPTRGRLVEDASWSDGNFFSGEYIYKRTQFDPAPDLTEKDFEITLPDGLRIYNEDDRHSGVVYEWREGKVVPAFSDFAGTAEGKWSGRSVLFVLFWFVAGVVLLSVSLRYIWRYKKTGG